MTMKISQTNLSESLMWFNEKKSENTVNRLRGSMKLGEQQIRRENTPYHELHNYALSIDGI